VGCQYTREDRMGIHAVNDNHSRHE
jgi:hypothetical protein